MSKSMYRGCVDLHNVDRISGWCEHASSSESDAPLEVKVVWNERVLRVVRARYPRPDAGKPTGRYWFKITDQLRRLLPKGTKLVVLAPDGTPLPDHQAEKHVLIGEAEDGGAALSAKLDEGYVVDKWGGLKLPFGDRKDLRKRYAAAMRRVSEAFANRTGIVPFPHYGTLLGYARQGSFLDHDDDVDLSFLLRCKTIEDVVWQFYDVVGALRSAGHNVRVVETGQFQLVVKDAPGPPIDFFASWITQDLRFYSYFGVGGELGRDIHFTPRVLEGVPVLIPDCHEEILELTYGPGWRVPDPSFDWVTPEPVLQVMNALRALGSSRKQALLRKAAA